MTLNSIIKRFLAISLGLAFTAADGVNTILQAIESGMPRDLVITVGVTIVGMALSLPIAIWAFKNQNKYHGILGIVVFLGCWWVSYGFSANRMGTNRMNEVHALNKANVHGMLAAEDLTDAREKLKRANAVLAREAVSGKGPKWQEAFNLKKQAEEDIAKAESKIEPLKTLPTFEKTKYLVYALPFVAQGAGVVFLLIGFGSTKPGSKQRGIEKQIEATNYLTTNRGEELSILSFLKKISDHGRWSTSYRKIHEATGVNTALVKERLTDLIYRGEIRIDGCSKGKGTWGVIIERELV